MTEPQNPLVWLWEQLFALLPPDQYLELHAQFEAQQRRYSRASLLRHTRRELAYYERIVATGGTYRPQYYRDKIERRKQRIAALEDELGNV